MINQKNRMIAINGLLSAIICVISFFPLRTLGLEITFSMVPVAVGACLFGPASGTILGTVFGLVSFSQCFLIPTSAFGAALFQINPFFTFLVCVPTRVLAGYLTGLLSSLIKKKASNTPAYLVGSISAPVLNTLLFMTTLCLCFYKTEIIQNFVTLLGAANPFTFVVLFVGINGLVEIIAGFILAFPILKAVSKYMKFE